MEFIISHHSCDIKVPVVYFSDTTYFIANSLNECHQKNKMDSVDRVDTADRVDKRIIPLMTFIYCIRSAGISPREGVTDILDFTMGQEKAIDGRLSKDGNYLFFKFLYDNLLHHSLLGTNSEYDDARRIIAQVVYDYEHVGLGRWKKDKMGTGTGAGTGAGAGTGRIGFGGLMEEKQEKQEKHENVNMKIVRYEVSDVDIEPPIIIVYYEDGRMREMYFEVFMRLKPDDLELNDELRAYAQDESYTMNLDLDSGSESDFSYGNGRR
jgi:hypothetical protein